MKTESKNEKITTTSIDKKISEEALCNFAEFLFKKFQKEEGEKEWTLEKI